MTRPLTAGDPSLTQILSRTAAALLGGYAFIWGFVTLGIAALVAGGMSYDQAWMLVMMLAFLVFLGVFLWAFVARSAWRVWGVLAGGGAVMALGASLVAAQLGAGA